MMKTVCTRIVLLCLAILGIPIARAANHEVRIENFSFNPANITINVGDTVTWRQVDVIPHTSTSGQPGQQDGRWNSGFLNAGQTFPHTFDEAGNFPYFCIPHPDMRGRVIVQAAQPQAPTVSITSPANNATLSDRGTVTISANATVSGSTITMVEFFSGSTFLGMDHDAPFSFSADLAPGTHSLTAKATAANGQTTISAPITVTVTGTPAAPTVAITSPANNTILAAPGPVTITAEASVTGSTITMVEFLNGSTSLGMDHEAPFTVTAQLAAGTHSLTARATAANGQTTTSAPITVTVNTLPQAPTVTITAPANNTTLPPGPVTLSANAAVTGSTISMVEFFSGPLFLGMVHDSPFNVTSDFTSGTYTITARATAANGQTATSTPITLIIATPTPTATPVTNPYPAIVKSDITVEVQTIADGMAAPLGLAAPNDGSGRLFVFDQTGIIYVIANGTRLATPLLDLSARMVTVRTNYDERGLLGLALHPNFNQNGLLYTYFSAPNGPTADFPITGTQTNNHQSILAEWKIDAADSNRVDAASYREIMRIDQPQSNHNGGVMHFGPDGMLYLALGDGGGADDEGSGHSPEGNGQDLEKILGKIIRIDVNTRTAPNGKYGVPNDNPFVGVAGLDEIWAYGFRNPYSWSFDRLNGEMLVGDVGQNMIEEVDRVFKGGNYGWRIKEGTFFFHPNGTNAGFIATNAAVANVPANLVDPIAEYDHSEGLSIIGGYVYRGSRIPGLFGKYVTGDFGTFGQPVGRLFYLDRKMFREPRLGIEDRPLGIWIKGFGEDAQGELYVLGSTTLGPAGTTGRVLKLVPVTNNLSITSIHHEGTNVMLTFTGGVGPFVIQGKHSIDDVMWHTMAATSQRTATIPAAGRAGFLRVADASGNPALGFSVSLSGLAERPNPVTNSPATGLGTMSLEGNTLHFDIRYSGLLSPATLAHIHGAASASQAAGVLVDLAPYNGGAFGTAGVLAGSITLTPEQKAHVLAGRTYVNIHTTNYPGGEIRGQIVPVVFTSTMNGAKERPTPAVTPARGSATLLLVGNQLTFNSEYSGLLSRATLAHIHGPADPETPAGVMVDLAPYNGGAFGTSGTMGGTITLTANQLAALVDGLTYINIHTTNYPGGEIRGQIFPASTAIALSALINGANERPDAVQTAGAGSATLALEGNQLAFNTRYSALTQPATLAHIHGPATAAQATGVLIDLRPFNGGAFNTNGTLSGSVMPPTGNALTSSRDGPTSTSTRASGLAAKSAAKSRPSSCTLSC